MDSILDQFKELDPEESGLIKRSSLTRILKDVGCVGVDVMLDSFAEVHLNYEDFVRWLHGERGQSQAVLQAEAAKKTGPLPEALPQLGEVAASLDQLAASLATVGSDFTASMLQTHAESLRRIRRAAQPFEPARPASAEVRPASAEMSMMPEMSQHSRQRQSNLLSFRDSAASIVQGCANAGDPIDDLQEVNIADVKNRSAISYWRFCRGIRLYRSETVSKALRLICSAPVPGLGGPSYLDVFGTLTNSEWEHHIFLFGGLVRDILRRKVGNDIDIAFSAPALELEEICRKHGYKCQLSGDYISIGDERGEEYLEGMVITHNGIQPTYHADFSMNWLFYDFCNDLIIDKSGDAVPAVMANRCDIPCPQDQWGSWIEVNGARVLFRYYKFLIRGYTYNKPEMAYVAERLLEFWRDNAEDTIETGRDALGGLVGCEDADKIECLKQLVMTSFEVSAAGQNPQTTSKRKLPVRRASTKVAFENHDRGGNFLSANLWWQRGWLELLKLPSSTLAEC